MVGHHAEPGRRFGLDAVAPELAREFDRHLRSSSCGGGELAPVHQNRREPQVAFGRAVRRSSIVLRDARSPMRRPSMRLLVLAVEVGDECGEHEGHLDAQTPDRRCRAASVSACCQPPVRLGRAALPLVDVAEQERAPRTRLSSVGRESTRPRTTSISSSHASFSSPSIIMMSRTA